MTYSISQLDQLAWAIDSDGLARHEADAAAVVQQARLVGLETPLLEVLADRSMPTPVRERAFGKVVNALVHAGAADAAASPEWALAN